MQRSWSIWIYWHHPWPAGWRRLMWHLSRHSLTYSVATYATPLPSITVKCYMNMESRTKHNITWHECKMLQKHRLWTRWNNKEKQERRRKRRGARKASGHEPSLNVQARFATERDCACWEVTLVSFPVRWLLARGEASSIKGPRCIHSKTCITCHDYMSCHDILCLF